MFRRVKRFLMVHTLPPLVYVFLLLLRSTLRVEHVNRKQMEDVRKRTGSVIACFWHGRLLLMPFAVKGAKAKVLISRHRDGEFIARVIGFFGLGTVRGSHGKSGGVASIREMIAATREGFTIAVTPDGPKGPKQRIKQGLIELARISQKPIFPVAYGARKKKLSTPGTASSFPIPFRRLSFCGETLSTSTGMLLKLI
jgi:lysophospholipid acyltransferase (LPLAT)-like uncharacterized protein